MRSPEQRLLEVIFGKKGYSEPMSMIKDAPLSLCDSCRYMQRARRKGSNDWLYDCGNGESPYFNAMSSRRGPQGLPPIEACSGYLRKGAMSLNEMHRTGWLLSTDPKRPIGFVQPGTEAYKEIEKEGGDRWNRPLDPSQLTSEPD